MHTKIATRHKLDSVPKGKTILIPEDIFNDHDPVRAIQSGKTMARAWARSLEAAEQTAYGQSFTFKMMEAYWQKVHEKELGRPLPFLFKKIDVKKLDKAAAGVAEAIGVAAAGLPVIQASYLLGNVYTAVLPEATRASGGVFYTPPALTARLIRVAGSAGVDWAKARVIDPACGGGAFLAPVCMKMIEALKGENPQTILKHIETHLSGWEIDPFGGWLTQVFVEVVLKDLLLQTKIKLAPLVKISDSLNTPLEQFTNGFDLVIGNPPYGKLKLTEAIRSRFKDSLYGHPNLYGLFTHLALQLTRERGVVALLTPTSFLSGEYFKNLRQLIRKESMPLELDFVSFRKGVFEDVLQETMLAVYKKGKGKNGKVKINQLITLAEGLETHLSGSFELPVQPTAPWILPRHPKQAILVKAMANMKARLSNWGYEVSTGPLVWNRHKKQLDDKKSPDKYPVIWAEAVTQDGRFVLKAEKKNHSAYFQFQEGDEWLITRNPCILLQRTTAKEQEKRLIAAALPDDLLHHGVIIENHLNMIIPCVDKPSVTTPVLAAFLNSQVVNEAFRTISGSVAVSAYELESLPLPAVSKLKKLHKLILNDAAPAAIESAIKELYTPPA